MKTYRLISLFAALCCICASCTTEPAGRWSEQKAKEWYDAQEWPVGCNYIPATAINQIEMWGADSYDPETIEKELGWAEGLGFNTLRVYLSSVVWQNDPEGMKERMTDFLDICGKHSMKALFVFFDDCWNAESAYGKQPEPKPGVHNSGWVQDPSVSLRADTLSLYPALKSYVQDVLETFADDERILMWDLYNEPGNSGHEESSAPLLKNVFAWAREVNPSQPLTVCVWDYYSPRKSELCAIALNNSDIISYHNYSPEDNHRTNIAYLKMLNRPLVCTEYMARRNGSFFMNILPLLKNEKVGAINWGFVAGKSNTIYAWDEPIPDGSEPALWFHDIFRPDGEPYRVEEVECIKSLTANN